MYWGARCPPVYPCVSMFRGPSPSACVTDPSQFWTVVTSETRPQDILISPPVPITWFPARISCLHPGRSRPHVLLVSCRHRQEPWTGYYFSPLSRGQSLRLEWLESWPQLEGDFFNIASVCLAFELWIGFVFVRQHFQLSSCLSRELWTVVDLHSQHSFRHAQELWSDVFLSPKIGAPDTKKPGRPGRFQDP